MIKIEIIIDFVVNNLSAILVGNGWQDITTDPAIGTLGNKFFVFVRSKNLTSLVGNAGNDFSWYPSLQILRELSQKTFVVAYDSEWQDFPKGEGINRRNWTRFILSWQFSYIRDGDVYEVIFIARNCKERLNLASALSVIYTLFDGGTGKSVSKSVHFKGKRIPICLLCHTGFVDLSATERKKVLCLMKRLTSVHKGLISMQSIKYNAFLNHPQFATHRRYYPFNLSVRDTLVHAPAGHRSLRELGRAVGYQKVTLGDDWISRMGELLVKDPVAYMEYAATDSTVTLLYAGAMYGYNALPAVTITSITANVMHTLMCNYLGIIHQEDFDLVYRGLRKIPTGTEENLKGDIPYLKSYEMEPLNAIGQNLQYIASKAYHGGYNGCSKVGYFDHVHTYDYDLLNAYPTSMCCVSDVDWISPVADVIYNVDFDTVFDKFFGDDNPMQTLLYAEVERFQFPSDVKFTNIVTMKNNIPVYTQSYDFKAACNKDVGRIYTTGVELYLAHKLGAKIHCSTIFVVNTRKMWVGNGMQDSKCLSVAVKQLVSDRLSAKQYAKANGIKNYLPDTILKNMVNSGYGKVAQDVIGKTSWDAYTNTMKDIGASKITNPVSASLITAIVRCVLIAAQNQCVNLGYSVFSATTDGFISNVPLETLRGMDLYGFRKLLSDARLFLTDGKNPEIWEMKHQQARLLNFTTRGNVAPNSDGVCAHTGLKNKDLVKESYEDRLWLTHSVLSRTGPIEFVDTKWDTFKEFVQGKVLDFHTEEIQKKVSVDFDLKRKPIRDSFVSVYPVVDGEHYELADFDTEPYLNIGEYNTYRNKGYSITHAKYGNPAHALRTLYDWDSLFFSKLRPHKAKKENTMKLKPLPHELSGRKANRGYFKNRIYTAEEKVIIDKIRNCLYAHFAGAVSIPLLKSNTRKEFCDVLNNSGISPMVITSDMMKNYAKPDRFPHPLETKCVYMIDHFLQEQEPVLSQLLALQPTSPAPSSSKN